MNIGEPDDLLYSNGKSAVYTFSESVLEDLGFLGSYVRALRTTAHSFWDPMEFRGH